MHSYQKMSNCNRRPSLLPVPLLNTGESRHLHPVNHILNSIRIELLLLYVLSQQDQEIAVNDMTIELLCVGNTRENISFRLLQVGVSPVSVRRWIHRLIWACFGITDLKNIISHTKSA